MKGIPTNHPQIGPASLRTLAIILDKASRREPVTVRGIAKIRGVDGNAAMLCLDRLRYLGLVDWEENTAASIRPTCTIEMFDREPQTG